MMSGGLMPQGFPPITISPENDSQFREYLLQFYETGEKQTLIQFLKNVRRPTFRRDLYHLKNTHPRMK